LPGKALDVERKQEMMPYLTGEEQIIIVMFCAGYYVRRAIYVLIHLIVRPLF